MILVTRGMLAYLIPIFIQSPGKIVYYYVDIPAGIYRYA